ncbi:uncharacterized protein LOC134280478 [Saccostrea cucullata]|uniref:uncharacterized protein LOC134280478 n=1 Tax=Saccostrea cuccullata TaxID=36930 RepID=UPI002ED6BF73
MAPKCVMVVKSLQMAEIHSLLTQMNSKLTNIESKNNCLEVRLTEIEKKISVMGEIQTAVTTVSSHVKVMAEEMNTIKNDQKELESNMCSLGNLFDSVKDAVGSNSKQINENRKELVEIREGKATDLQLGKGQQDQKTLNEASDNLRESMIDLKARSMRDNLMFSGIWEEKNEDTEAVLQEFIYRKFKPGYEISFERVHRMGKWNEFNEFPRNIVAKFSFFKDREFIRTRAPQKLSGTRIWVNEQYYRDRRKKERSYIPSSDKPGGITKKYYAAKKHASLEGCCLPPPEKEDIRQRMVQSKYLKTDYKIHVAETSDVADHCRRYALSDCSKLFSLECNHDHTNFCEACEQLKEVVGDVKQLVDNFDFSAREDKDDIIFRLKFAETGILGWKAHLLRSKNQEEAKQEVLRSLSISNACIILDWAMKYLPHKYREDSQDWFGKRGISWHIAVVFIKDEEILKALTYVHIFEGQICQDASVTTAVILDVIHGLRQEYPDISTINLWSDNAGCYKSSETISTLYHHCKTVNSFDFCEAQDGKGACDRSAAVIKANIRRFVNEGHDVVTARQMKQAIEKTSRKVKYRVKVVEVETTERQKFRPVPGISTLNNFKFLGERVQVWRQYGIGDGMTIPGKNLSNIQPTSLKILEGDSAEVHFHSILKPLSKEEQHVFTCSHESCVSTFSTSEELDHHLIVGSCDLKLEKERSNDLVVQKYAKILQKENREQYTLSCISKESTDDSILKKGWALKEERKCVRFSKKQKSYLEDKFKAGLKSGRKEDPVSVSEEMRKLKNKDGERVFALEELLSAQQIAGFFSRMCKKSQSAIDESLFDSIHAIL